MYGGWSTMQLKVTIFVVILCAATGVSCVQLHISRSTVVLAGRNATVICQAGVPITRCRIKLPGLETLTLSPTTPGLGGFSYYGKGLQLGDCGVTISQVTDLMHGTVSCTVNTKLEKAESTASTTLIVAKRPSSLDLRTSREYKENDVLTASCVATGARPAATIEWFLDNDVIVDGVGQPMIVEDSSRQLSSTTVNLTRTLSWRDNNRTLGCSAIHVTLKEREKMITTSINVLFAPNDFKTVMERTDFIVGRPGTVSVTLRANPQPRFKWLFGNIVLESGGQDPSGKYKADLAVNIGEDRWWAALRISEVMPADVGLFLLEAANTVGEEKYPIIVKEIRLNRGMTSSSSASLVVALTIVVVLCCTLIVIAIVAVVRARFYSSDSDHTIVSSSSDSLGGNSSNSLAANTQPYDPLPTE